MRCAACAPARAAHPTLCHVTMRHKTVGREVVDISAALCALSESAPATAPQCVCSTMALPSLAALRDPAPTGLKLPFGSKPSKDSFEGIVNKANADISSKIKECVKLLQELKRAMQRLLSRSQPSLFARRLEAIKSDVKLSQTELVELERERKKLMKYNRAGYNALTQEKEPMEKLKRELSQLSMRLFGVGLNVWLEMDASKS